MSRARSYYVQVYPDDPDDITMTADEWIDSDPEPTSFDTGLIDQYGNKIIRVVERETVPFGFRGKEG